MARRRGFTLIELLVVIAIIALLLSILMPAMRRVREQGKMIGCLANLKQWNLVAAMFTESNDGKFWKSDDRSPGFWFPAYMDDKTKDYKANKTWFCPSSQKPVVDAGGRTLPTLNIYNAWGIFTARDHAGLGPNGISGSFGINGYCLIPQAYTGNYQSGVKLTDGFRTVMEAVGKNPNNIPWWIEALRFDLWPLPTEAPAQNEFAAWTDNLMSRCCINRHQGMLNAAFLDWSVRKLGIKEVYTLQWHKTFNTRGPWTIAGGVQDSDWPDWIRPFKDY